MNNLVKVLGGLTAVASLLVIGFLVGSFWNKPVPGSTGSTSPPPPPTLAGQSAERSEVKNLPPPPKPVPDEARVRENLKEGKTYAIRTKGALNMRATDKDWGFSTVCTVNYAFTALIERTIEKNDGVSIQELRYFKEVKSLKLDTSLDSARLELGATGDFIFGGLLLYFRPDTLHWFVQTKFAVENAELKDFLGAFGADQSLVSSFLQQDPMAKAFTAVGGLQGKKVRIVYRNDPDVSKRGVIRVTPVDSEMTSDERAFHFSSSLLTDSLIFPNTEVKVGDTWEVDGINFIGLIDPALLAYTDGKVTVQRGKDQLLAGKSGRYIQLKAVGGELTFYKSNEKAQQQGNFKPTGELLYSAVDQIVVKGRLKGSGKMNAHSKDHLLFETRSDREPTMEVEYTCTILDAPEL